MYPINKDKAEPYFEKAKELFAKKGSTSIFKTLLGRKRELGLSGQMQ